MNQIQVTRLSLVGWNFKEYQGGFKVEPGVTQKQLCSDSEQERQEAYSPFLYGNYSVFDAQCGSMIQNVLACIPLLNVLMGIARIVEAFRTSPQDHFIAAEEETKFRIVMVTVGILEVTLIGGIIVHSIASLYFYMKRNNIQT